MEGIRRERVRWIVFIQVLGLLVSYQRTLTLFQPLFIPKWKRERFIIDFVTTLLRNPKGNKSIWVIADRLIKLAYFISF